MTTPHMRLIPFACMIALLGVMHEVYAFCVPGTIDACFLNGKQGTRTCMSNGFFGPCQIPADPPPPSGTAQPKYKILTVIYAPPGTQGGGSTSSVAYGSGSTVGSTVSGSETFKQNYAVSVSAKAGFLGDGGEIGGSFSYGRNSSDSETLDIKKTASMQINHRGPAVDGIDHDRDQIWLWLGPTVQLSLTPTAAEWTVDESQIADLQYVYVGHLKDPSLMPPGVAARLQAYGITPDDFAEILQADPFTDDMLPIDTDRFQPLHTTFPYEPPFAPGDPVPTLSFTATYAETDAISTSVANEYSVGVTVSGSFDFLSLFQAKAKAESKWTWTDTDTRSEATGTSESVSVTIGGPAFGYSGPTDMAVYYDVLYKTFVFIPIEPELPPALHGSVISSAQQAVSGKEVILLTDGVQYRTFTNAKGEYRMYGEFSGPLQLQVDGVKFEPVPRQNKVDIMLPPSPSPGPDPEPDPDPDPDPEPDPEPDPCAGLSATPTDAPPSLHRRPNCNG